MPSELLDEILNIRKDVSVVYVSDHLNDKNNSYLQLLYDGFDKDIEVKRLRYREYPILAIKSVFSKNYVFHQHWLQAGNYKSALRLLWKLFCLTLFSLFKGKIIWTVHNKHPHNESLVFFNKLIRIYFAQVACKIHVHCDSAIDIMSPILKVDRKKFFVVEHPNYKVNTYDKEKAQAMFVNRFGIDIDFNKRLFLIFGQVARYKGIKELLDVFNDVEYPFNLIIAGKIKSGNDDYFSCLSSYMMNEKFIFLNSFIDESDVPVLFNMSDCVLFNYLDILTSGGVVLSLNYHKKTIAPHMGCIRDLRDDNLYTFENTDELLKLINNEEKVLQF